jgi:tetratricopeptide (TPR) repeat protein
MQGDVQTGAQGGRRSPEARCAGLRSWSAASEPRPLEYCCVSIWRLLTGLIFLIVLTPSQLRADVIYLKNGRKIVAAVAREDARQIYLVREGGEYALPRSLVDRVEKSPPSPLEESVIEPSEPAERRDLPLPPPPAAEETSDSPVIKDGIIDEAYLRQLDDDFSRNPSADNQQRLKRGYREVAVFQVRKGDAEAAIERYRHILRLVPNDHSSTLALGYLLVTQNHFLEAMDVLLPATDRKPRSPDLHLLLGSAFYGMENLDQAIAEWNKALALQDDPKVREAIAKAERERETTSAYMELRSDHFLLRYEGREVEALSSEVLRTLEVDFRNLALELDYSPRETIVVLLYPDQAFRDIARSPSWVGAVNDGKIRVPVSGLASMTPDLARVLRHELTHSFIRQITLGRCPTWFNEGLAQLQEGATTTSLGTQLARAFVGGRMPSFPALEGSFMNLPADQVGLAYAKSLAALEYLRETYGMGEVRRLLKALPGNPDLNSLLQDEIRLDYPAFEQEVAHYIVKRYGA